MAGSFSEEVFGLFTSSSCGPSDVPHVAMGLFNEWLKTQKGSLQLPDRGHGLLAKYVDDDLNILLNISMGAINNEERVFYTTNGKTRSCAMADEGLHFLLLTSRHHTLLYTRYFHQHMCSIFHTVCTSISFNHWSLLNASEVVTKSA